VTYWNMRVNSNGYYLVELYERGSATALFRRSFSDRLLAQDYCDLMNRKQLTRGVK
jgi:hypothetical protein